MSVSLKIDRMLKQLAGDIDTVNINGSTIAECLSDLIRRFPDIEKKIYDNNGILIVMILHNGKAVYQKNLQNPVNDGDKLQLLIVMSGG